MKSSPLWAHLLFVWCTWFTKCALQSKTQCAELGMLNSSLAGHMRTHWLSWVFVSLQVSCLSYLREFSVSTGLLNLICLGQWFCDLLCKKTELNWWVQLPQCSHIINSNDLVTPKWAGPHWLHCSKLSISVISHRANCSEGTLESRTLKCSFMQFHGSPCWWNKRFMTMKHRWWCQKVSMNRIMRSIWSFQDKTFLHVGQDLDSLSYELITNQPVSVSCFKVKRGEKKQAIKHFSSA